MAPKLISAFQITVGISMELGINQEVAMKNDVQVNNSIFYIIVTSCYFLYHYPMQQYSNYEDYLQLTYVTF